MGAFLILMALGGVFVLVMLGAICFDEFRRGYHDGLNYSNKDPKEGSRKRREDWQ